MSPPCTSNKFLGIVLSPCILHISHICTHQKCPLCRPKCPKFLGIVLSPNFAHRSQFSHTPEMSPLQTKITKILGYRYVPFMQFCTSVTFAHNEFQKCSFSTSSPKSLEIIDQKCPPSSFKSLKIIDQKCPLSTPKSLKITDRKCPLFKKF